MKKSVKIFGLGTLREKALLDEIRSVARQLGLEIDVEEISDIESFLEKGLPAIPALSVEDQVVANGRFPAREEIVDWLRA